MNEHTHAMTKDGVTRIWDVRRLWRLAEGLPRFQLAIDELRPYLELDCWFGGKAPTTAMVARHARQIYEADLAFPIILNQHGGLMDGTHRLAKAWILGHASILAVRFERTPEPDQVLQGTRDADPAAGAARE